MQSGLLMSLSNIFSQMGNIEDYLRFVKEADQESTSSLAPLHDEFFNEDIHPEDMEFDIKFVGSRFPQSIPQRTLWQSLESGIFSQ